MYNFIIQNIPIIFTVIGASIVIFVYYLLGKGSKPLIRLVDEAVVSAENSFNSGEGKQKLEFAFNFIEKNLNFLPWYVKSFALLFLTRKRIIDLIEMSLNRLSIAFGSGKKVDIKGNE
jgi:phage holin, LL-H family